jgi:hypothetical protein
MVIDYSLPRRSPTKLQRLRSVLFDKETDLDVICRAFVEYSSIDEYVPFENVIDGRRILSLVPKRGNVKYASAVKKRFEELIKPFELKPELDVTVENGYTNVLFQTLTFDTKLSDFKTAWLTIGVELNRYVANLAKQYKSRVLIDARCFESFKNGYPHVHLILYFLGHSFHTFKMYSQKSKRWIWRIETSDRNKMRRFWRSNIDVQGIVSMRESLRYLEKYIAKASNLALNDSENKGLKTLACSWAFGKRSYSVSKKFKEIVFERYLALPVSDLNRLTAIQTVPVQVTLGLSVEGGSGEFGGVPVLDNRDFVKWSLKSKKDKPVSNWIRRKQHFRKADFEFWGCGNFPKDKLGFDTAFSFGLSDAQNFVLDQFLGKMPLEGEISSKAIECALSQKVSCRHKYKRLKAGTWRDMKHKSVPNPVEDKPVPVPVVEDIEGLSGLELISRKLCLAIDSKGAFEGSVTPSLDSEGNLKPYYSEKTQIPTRW